MLVPNGNERKRVERQIASAIADLGLDLHSVRILTEAASGSFSVTSIAAAMAGGDVVAVVRDSTYGKAIDVKRAVESWSATLGLEARLKVQIGRPIFETGGIDLVTNLGFVRPIDRSILGRLSKHAAIALMWEPWELRAGDIDIGSAEEFAIPIIGTNESHPRVGTFGYLPMLAAKLLLEVRCAITGASLAVVGSDPFGTAIANGLSAMGASVSVYNSVRCDGRLDEWYESLAVAPEAVVVAEHRSQRIIVGDSGGLRPDRLAKCGVAVVHLAGRVDEDAIRQAGVMLHPPNPAPPGQMTVTTGYLGAKPVIDLHVAGLRAAELVVRARRVNATPAQAISAAVDSGVGLAMPQQSIDRRPSPIH